MKLILMRHGESEGNIKQGFISGRKDPAILTSKGTTQIIRTAWELRNELIELIGASPVVRAQKTAEILHSYFQRSIQTIEWLTELNHGIFEGNYWWEVIHKIPPSWRAKREDFHTPYPQGESMEMLIKRVWKGLQDLVSTTSSDSTVILVSHQAVIGGMKYIFEHGDPAKIQSPEQIEHFLKFLHSERLPNGGFIETEISEGKFKIIQEKKEFQPVPSDENSVAFYSQGMFQLKSVITAHHKDTASENEVYKIEDSNPLILKILKGKETKVSERQMKLYEYLHQKHLPVPFIKYFDSSRVFFEHDVLVQDYIEGEESKACSHNHPEKFATLLHDVFAILEKIHALPVNEVKEFWRPPGDAQLLEWKQFMHFNINLTIHGIQEDIFSEEVMQHITHTLNELRGYVLNGSYQIGPIHGDLAAGNIITTHTNGECHLQRLIDFEWARLGDRLWDFAYYWGWLERENEQIAHEWKSILENNLTAEEMIHLNQFKTLFHAWTVRDMKDYKGNLFRERRGKKSQEILEGSLTHHI